MTSKVEIRIAGGMSEVGVKNGVVIAYDGNGLCIDRGQKIPEFSSSYEREEMMSRFGAVLPDEYYLGPEGLDDLRVGFLCLTHGHQDHTESWWKLRERFPDIALITDRFTEKVIRMRAEKDGRAPPEALLYGENIQAGPFSIRRFAVNHSIYGSSGFLVEAEGKRIAHLGDVKSWRVRAGHDKNVEVFGALHPEKGIHLMFLDSTNADEPGFVISEEAVEAKIAATLTDNRNARVFFSTIASNVRRLESAINAANKQGRPVFVAGRSMRDLLDIAGIDQRLWQPIFQSAERDNGRELTGFRHLVPSPSQLPDDAVICVTGSQGEPMSFLDSMAEEIFPLPAKQGDTLIVSQDTIPLRDIERRFSYVMGELSGRFSKIYLTDATPEIESRGATIIRDPYLHASGHGKQGDLKLLLSHLKPRIVVPCHAGRAKREVLAELVKEWGADWSCEAVLLDDGDRFTL
ncbi:MAG: ribonuclease J [Candidatus Spechtbacterales bacterium]